MLELGKVQTLKINRLTSIGAFLTDEKGREEVLLPKKQVPENAKEEDSIEVFLYKDSEDRLISTTRKPKITLDEIAVLKVIEVNKIGAFLDWGLEKDLLLPFSEQTMRVRRGREYAVSLYIDKSKRLSATMDLYNLLSSQSPYKVNDTIQGVVYDFKEEFGAFVVIDYKYHGLIPKHEWLSSNQIGDVLDCRVTSIREDGKLNLSLKEKAYIQMDTDVEVIMEALNKKGGKLLLNDHSSPEEINNVLNMSKKAFKRAVGRMLKQDKITITEDGIELKNNNTN